MKVLITALAVLAGVVLVGFGLLGWDIKNLKEVKTAVDPDNVKKIDERVTALETKPAPAVDVSGVNDKLDGIKSELGRIGSGLHQVEEKVAVLGEDVRSLEQRNRERPTAVIPTQLIKPVPQPEWQSPNEPEIREGESVPIKPPPSKRSPPRVYTSGRMAATHYHLERYRGLFRDHYHVVSACSKEACWRIYPVGLARR